MRAASLALAAVLLGAGTAAAQTQESDSAPAPLPAVTPAWLRDQVRACDGCPPRRLGTSFIQVTLVNGIYELANLIRGQETAKITPKTWWTNMKRGWEWDLDDFVVNQIGHPYQGNNYFTTGRANGLSFWESSALTAFGSGTWEYFGETNQASLNDFINTTLGGIALGEMFHRTAWLIRDPSKTGKSRLWNEIGATAIDPMTGLNRFLTGDASRVAPKPPDLVPSSLNAIGRAGAMWRGSNTETIAPGTYAFFETDLLYGDITEGRTRNPYDAFAVRLAFGGGSPISEARVRGRLFSEPLGGNGLLLSVSQGYQFGSNDAYEFGMQSVEVSLGGLTGLTSKLSLFASGWAGVNILGAVDSIPFGETPVDEEEDPDAPQGVSTGPRYYDYGPGVVAGGILQLRRGSVGFLTVLYELHHLRVLDGVRANHVLQRFRADVMVPIRRQLGAGATAEFFDRHTYYTPGQNTAQYHFPQFRVYLTWRVS